MGIAADVSTTRGTIDYTKNTYQIRSALRTTHSDSTPSLSTPTCPSHEASSEVRLAEQPSAPPPPSTAPPGRARGQSTPGSPLPPRTRRLRTPSDSSEASVVLVATSA